MFRLIRDKYRSLGEPVKASLWFLICGFLHKGIAFLTTPIYTRIMTEAEFGRANIYISWYNIITVIATLQLAAGVYMRGLVKNEEDADAFSSALLTLSTVCILKPTLKCVNFASASLSSEPTCMSYAFHPPLANL